MFKISYSIQAHSADVRCLLVDSPHSILTSSRDFTSKRFTKGEDGILHSTVCTSQHPKYVSAVCHVEASDEFPEGLIVTGCNDSRIRVFLPGECDLLETLKGHEGEISSLFYAANVLISGSLDCTAIVWVNFEVAFRLRGHSLPVWSVAIHRSRFLTGSADKTIRLWDREGCVRIFRGHSDCVRGLAVTDSLETFLSCSNDGTVRSWGIDSPETTSTFYGHTSYVYCVKFMRGDDSMTPQDELSFVSSGEDRSVRVWEGGSCVQTIYLPVQSVWCAECLPNGDVVSGSSDGVIRIFSREESRVGGEQVRKEFDEAVAEATIPFQMGDLGRADLKGEERLERPGAEGQVVMVKTPRGIEAFSWSGGAWSKIGSVVGATNRQTFEGREYDYVFDVDLEDISPPRRLKLPFNRGESFDSAARAFIQRNGLPPAYHSQIVDFLRKNTGATPPHRFVPIKSFEQFSSLQLAAMITKLRELSGYVPVPLEDADFEQLSQLESRFPSFLGKLMSWPVECVFPLIDILRYSLVAHPFDSVNLFLSTEDFGEMLRLWFVGFGKNRIPIMKLVANGLSVDMGRPHFICLFLHLKGLFYDVGRYFSSPLFVRIFAAMLSNVTVACRESIDSVEDAENAVVQLAVCFIRWSTDKGNVSNEHLVTVLGCVGTLLIDNPRLCGLSLTSFGLQDLLLSMTSAHFTLPVVNCADAVSQVLQDTLG